MGLPHNDPVTNARKVNDAPRGAQLRATASATLVFQINPTAPAAAITT